MTDLTPADREHLDAWWAAIAENRGVLPDDIEPVQTRLVRAVGRSVLPDAGEVFVKVMWFPRGKDRLRYVARRLPCDHEARMLVRCRAARIPVPDVVLSRGARRIGLPDLSMLVTAALSVVEVPAPAPRVVRVVRKLVEAGVFHPDLNSGNFLHLTDGSVAVIDLQSARWRPGGVQLAECEAMVTKMLADLVYHDLDLEPWLAALRESGIVGDEPERLVRHAEAIDHLALVGRVHRCLRESTEFTRRRSWAGTVHARRDRARIIADDDWTEGGPELFRYWMGDRTLEILETEEPVLSAVFRPAPWSRRPHRICLAGGLAALAAAQPRLEAGHDRYEDLVRHRMRSPG